MARASAVVPATKSTLTTVLSVAAEVVLNSSVDVWSVILSCRFFSHVNQLARLDEFPTVTPTPLIIEEETTGIAAHDEPTFLFVLLV